MSSIDSSGAVDGGRIRTRAAKIARTRDIQYGELVSMLQEQFEVSERKIRNELNKCFDARLLFRTDDSDQAEVRTP